MRIGSQRKFAHCLYVQLNIVTVPPLAIVLLIAHNKDFTILLSRTLIDYDIISVRFHGQIFFIISCRKYIIDV